MVASSTRYRTTRGQIEDGDLLLFRRPGSLLSIETDGAHTHSAMAVWRGDVLLLAESREWCGARLVTLSSQVRTNPGVIDVYKPMLTAEIAENAEGEEKRTANPFCGEEKQAMNPCCFVRRERTPATPLERLRWRAADLMVRQAGHAYGYAAIARYSLLRFGLVNLALSKLGFIDPPEDALEPQWLTPKFCSCQTEWCYRRASFETGVPFNPHPGLPSQFVTPNDQAHSAAFGLAFKGLEL